MNSNAIRQAFIDFFKERGHDQLPSLSLVPHDPNITTLFTIAGMQQMIPYFLGREVPPSKRLVTVQKAIRTADIDEVGDDTHLTFLEMLGNFSVGDYFKEGAIDYTWEFLTGTMAIPRDRWWATIYPGDEVARRAWLDVGLPPERIGETEDNWWAQGPTGPCGTDSEIHYDRGPEHGCGAPDCRPEKECCERFVETWNDVFMEYFRDDSGELNDLPWKNIDTGMGFERLTMIVQGVESVYDTDLFQPIIASVTALTGRQYRQDTRIDRSLRIIADHSRAFTFIIGDGVMPSSEGRGYVLRRLIRRAALHGRLLGIDEPFLTKPAQVVIDVMGGYYTELLERRRHILQVIEQEERRFLRTLERGLGIFEDMAEQAAREGTHIAGHDAFLLSDTYGFPLEMTSELAAERGLTVDRDGFEAALLHQQQMARDRQKFTRRAGTSPEMYASIAERIEPVVFTGYQELDRTTEVVGIIAEGQPVSRAEAGDEVEIVLAATPFYAEAGGQVGDSGIIRSDTGVAEVLDTQRPQASLIVHVSRIAEGYIAVGDMVRAEVDAQRRLHILPHHTGTHLIHKALQEVLGPEATQAGSLVAPDRLRFDFRWPRPLTRDELREVQDRVNAAIWANLPVRKETMPYDEAIRAGAMALFGEKYGDRVRVVSVDDWSKELCGGTHVNATGDIGLLIITGETGIGSGIRRIEALAGAAAYAYVNDLRELLHETSRALEARPDHLLGRVHQLTSELRESEKRNAELVQKLAAREAEALVGGGVSVDGVTVVADEIVAETKDYLEATTDAVKSRLDRGIVVLGSVVEGRPAFTAAVTRNLTSAGYRADQILRDAARSVGAGGAGGNAEFAQGGGRDASKLGPLIETAVRLIRQQAEG